MWHLKYAARIQKDLRKIPRKSLIRIKLAIEELTENPYTSTKQLKEHPLADNSTRVGVYRILFDIYDETKSIHILKIGHRKDVYR